MLSITLWYGASLLVFGVLGVEDWLGGLLSRAPRCTRQAGSMSNPKGTGWQDRKLNGFLTSHCFVILAAFVSEERTLEDLQGFAFIPFCSLLEIRRLKKKFPIDALIFSFSFEKSLKL